MNVLVTGATGFVGGEIVKTLREKGFNVYACGKKERADIPDYFFADVSSAESVNNLSARLAGLPGVDCIIHSAGLAHQFKAPKDRGVFERVNVDGTRNIAGMAAELGIRKLILISSISVYGDNKPNPCPEEAECRPSGDYAVSKYMAEKAALEICQKSGVDLVILRLATVYGEGDVGNVLRLIKLIDSGRFFWTGKGDNGKSLIYKGDVGAACRLGVEKALSGTHVYNVTDAAHTMREIVETIALNLGKKIPRFSVPAGIVGAALRAASILPVAGGRAKALLQTLKKWQSDDVLSGEKIKNELGFRIRTSLPEGIKREVEWYRSQNRER